jgi:fused-like protein
VLIYNEWQAVAYSHDSSGRVIYESTACAAVLLTRVASGLAALVAPGGEGPESVGGAATVEGQTMAQIIGQARTLGTADHLCSCLGTTGKATVIGHIVLLLSRNMKLIPLFMFFPS